MLLGERLKEIRNSLGLNQTQMTEEIINRSFYSRVEKGENSMSTQELMRLLYPHGVSMIEFCQGFGNTEPQMKYIKKLSCVHILIGMWTLLSKSIIKVTLLIQELRTLLFC